jgi:hypothetical protein
MGDPAQPRIDLLRQLLQGSLVTAAPGFNSVVISAEHASMHIISQKIIKDGRSAGVRLRLYQRKENRRSERWLPVRGAQYESRKEIEYVLAGGLLFKRERICSTSSTHPNFGPPDNVLTDALFGRSTQTLAGSFGSGGANGGFSPLYQIGGPRSAQLALKLVFWSRKRIPTPVDSSHKFSGSAANRDFHETPVGDRSAFDDGICTPKAELAWRSNNK